MVLTNEEIISIIDDECDWAREMFKDCLDKKNYEVLGAILITIQTRMRTRLGDGK